jgi:hypothetical protein
MSLNSWEQQTLESIEQTLARAEPSLDRLLGVFTRMTSAEGMPDHEEIPAGFWQAVRYPRSRRGRLLAGRIRRRSHQARLRLSSRWTAPLLWLAITGAMLAMALVLNAGAGHRTCTGSWSAMCTSQRAAHDSSTRPDRTANIPWVRELGG